MNVGGVCSILVAPLLCDMIGRRRTIAMGVVVIIVETIIQVVPGVNSGQFGKRRIITHTSNLNVLTMEGSEYHVH